MKPKDEDLYEYAKSIVYRQYEKPSAFRSGAVIKKYKELGGEFIDDKQPKKLKRWFKEEWKDVNPLKTDSSYPVFRPTIRVNKETPLTVSEVNPYNLIEQSIEKQIIKGRKNLKPFQKF